MSDKMSSREIEDVLSSIRRLVTEDFRPAARAEVVEPKISEPQASEKTPEKLLLTPSLRVVGGKAADLAAPAPETAPETAPEEVEEAPFVDVAAEAEDPANEPWLDSIVAALGEAARARPQEWEPELGDPAPVATAKIAPLRPVGLKLASVSPDLPKPAASRPAFPPAWAQPVPVEVPEPVTLKPDPTPEPKTRRDPIWLDKAEAEVRAALDDMPKTERIKTPPMEAVAEAEIEASELQQMVRDIIREELAGPLGERITRNIRKMVHAEIARALAARDYD